MTRRARAHAGFAIALAGSLGVASRAQAEPRKARVVWAKTSPTIDGDLSDAVWKTAPPVGRFFERKPKLRGTPPNRTTVRLVMDGAALYVGVHCHDTEPAQVRGRASGRDDNGIFRDDAFSVKLDPAHDHRTTYGFTMNPIGGRLDYRGIDESDFRIEWDTIWSGAAKRTKDGWSAEFRIPWRSLDIDPRRPPSRIGLNFTRDHSRLNATYDWSLLAPPFSAISASRYGHLDGLAALAKHAPSGEGPAPESGTFSLIPYSLSGYRQTQNSDTGNLESEALWTGGIDATGQLGQRWRGRLTVNTDFAQVDLDNQVVNLSRFGLFQPEKRDFFLSDLEVFSFGPRQDAQMLYTRRIGLAGGAPVPIMGGLKMVGRPHDKVRFGILQATTRPSDDLPWTSHLVARGLGELGGGSNVGVMMTHRQSLDDTDDRNIVVGVDGSWRGEEVPLLVTTWAAGSITGPGARDPDVATGGDGRGLHADRLAPSAGGRVVLRHPLISPSLSYNYLHPQMRGDLGFYRRVGVHSGSASVAFVPRIDEGGVNLLDFGPYANMVSSAQGDGILDYGGGAWFGVRSTSGFYAEAEGRFDSELVQNDFTVGRESTVVAGRYDMWRASLYGSTPSTQALSGSLRLTGRDYYGGRLLGADASLAWLTGDLLRLEAGGNYNRVDFESLPDFDSVVVNARATLGFRPDLGLRLYWGYNLLGDRLQVQSRLRWIYLPGSDLFLVYQLDLDDDTGRPVNNSLIAKSTFQWDVL